MGVKGVFSATHSAVSSACETAPPCKFNCGVGHDGFKACDAEPQKSLDDRRRSQDGKPTPQLMRGPAGEFSVHAHLDAFSAGMDGTTDNSYGSGAFSSMYLRNHAENDDTRSIDNFHRLQTAHFDAS